MTELLPSQPVHYCCIYAGCSDCLPLLTGRKEIQVFGAHLYQHLYNRIFLFEMKIVNYIER